MLVLLFAALCALSGYRAEDNCIPYPEPDVCRNASELIASKGYRCEDYTVQTQDGYLLGVQRIPCGRNGACTPGRPVVFLQHGLLSSSVDYLNNLANESLAYVLADAGYDVWLGNLRGNTYSLRHVKYTPDDDAFWAFSFDEMAKYDIVSMMNFALEKSGQKDLYYFGHSQGTMVGFIEFSRNDELAKKVKRFFALAPVSTVAHIKGAVRIMSYITPEIKDLFWLLGVKDFLPNDALIKIMGSTICKLSTKFLCKDLIFLICGTDQKQLNQTRLPVYVAHSPAGTSVQNILHFGQLVRSGKFQAYDYGSNTDNLKHYGQKMPPLYNVSNVHVPTYLFSGTSDWLADPQDVAGLIAKLPNLIDSTIVPGWAHLDFLWGIDARRVIYDPILAIMKKDTEALSFEPGLKPKDSDNLSNRIDTRL